MLLDAGAKNAPSFAAAAAAAAVAPNQAAAWCKVKESKFNCCLCMQRNPVDAEQLQRQSANVESEEAH